MYSAKATLAMVFVTAGLISVPAVLAGSHPAEGQDSVAASAVAAGKAPQQSAAAQVGSAHPASGAQAGEATAPSAAKTVTELITRPHSVSRWIVDDQGRVVTFHGENVASKVAPYTLQAHGFDEADAAFLQQQGFNAVRMGIYWAGAEPQPGVIDDNYLAQVKESVELLAQHGISTFLEYHQDSWSESLGGAGVPKWAVYDNNLPKIYGPLAGQASPALLHAVQYFWDNRPGPDGRGLQDHFKDVWEHTAEYFQDTPGIIGYGFINEPSIGYWQIPCVVGACPSTRYEVLRKFNADITARVRRHDKRVGIWVNGYITTVMGQEPHLGTPPDPNSVYSFNSYAGPCQMAEKVNVRFCYSDHIRYMAMAWRYAHENNIPMVMGEFGANDNPAILVDQRQLTDENMTSRFHWQYGGPDVWTLAPGGWRSQGMIVDPHQPPVGENMNWDLVKALATPYPAVVSGTPQMWEISKDNKSFTARWNTQRVEGGTFPAGAQSLIKVPDIWAPAGYRVEVTGGVVETPLENGIAHSRDLVITQTGAEVSVRLVRQ